MIDKCPLPDVLWYVLKLDNNRLTLTDTIAIQLIHKYFGDAIWDRTMIVCTHTDQLKTREKLQEFFNDRSEKISKAITKITKGKALGVPAVAVTNKKKFTPDGKSWLGNLFVTSFERLNPDRQTAFLLAFIMDLEIPKPQPPEPKVQNPTANSDEEVTENKGRIELSEDEWERVKESSISVSDVLTGVGVGFQIGASIDLATGGALLGIPTIVCSVGGGMVAAFLDWLWG